MTDPYIRWDRKPRYSLQTAAARPRTIVEAMADKGDEAAKRASRPLVTETNPSGIYAPPGDPLHRPQDWLVDERLSAPGETVLRRRWRWWRDPLVIGAAIGIAVIVGLSAAAWSTSAGPAASSSSPSLMR